MTTGELFERYKQVSRDIDAIIEARDMCGDDCEVQDHQDALAANVPRFLGLLCEQYLILKELTSAPS